MVKEVDQFSLMLHAVRLEKAKLDPCLLILDSSLIEFLGREQTLDLLFGLDIRLMLTDIVVANVIYRETQQRSGTFVAEWFAGNTAKITILNTVVGSKYSRAMELWKLAGMPSGLRLLPSETRQSKVLSTIQDVRLVLGTVEKLIVVTSIREARDAVKQVQASVPVKGTSTFEKFARQCVLAKLMDRDS